jgi:hypothetical protein
VKRPPERPGGHRPGALLATRLSILAAEAADPERYRRGRLYAKQRAVVDVEVELGEVVGVVQGSRAEPYRVTLHTSRAPGRSGAVPTRAEVRARCTCPDDVPMCKHAVAVLLEFADDVGRQPDLLERWRGPQPEGADVDPEPAPPRVAPGRLARHSPVPVEPEPDPLAGFFGVPDLPRNRGELPAVWPLLESPARPAALDDLGRLTGTVLDDALAALAAIFG